MCTQDFERRGRRRPHGQPVALGEGFQFDLAAFDARRADWLTSTVVGPHGWRGAAAGVAHAAGTNACGHHSATPYLTLPAHPGGTHLLVTSSY